MVLWNHQTGMQQVFLAVSGGGEESGNIHRNTCFYVADTIMLWRGMKSGRYMGWCTEKVFIYYILGCWRKKSIATVCSEKQASSFDWKTKHQEVNNILATNPRLFTFGFCLMALEFSPSCRAMSRTESRAMSGTESRAMSGTESRATQSLKHKAISHPERKAQVWDLSLSEM